jgi:hypothetical protein
MTGSRFSIGGLMALVLVIALGLVGLKQASPVWASTFFSVSLIVLVVSVLNAIQSRERARAFWLGFAVSGWAYFLCVFGIGSESVATAPPVLVGLLLDRSQPLLHPPIVNYIGPMPTPAPMPVAPIAVAPPLVMPSPPASPAPAPPAPPTPTLAYTINVASLTPATWTSANWTNDAISVPYRQIGHSFAALLVAYLGGLYSIFAASRRDRRRDDSDPIVSPSSP